MGANAELLKKADITVADLAANGGLLNPEQSNEFLRKLLIQPTILPQTRVVTMNSPQKKIEKIGFATRILRPATSGVSLDPSQRSKPTTETITLNTKEVIAEVRLPYDVIEDNIERGNIGTHQDVGGTPTSGGIKDTIMSMIAERVALDLEELALLGDTASGDPYLALVDGWLKNATSNVVDANGAPLTKDVFKQGLKGLPDQYKRNLSSLRQWVSMNQEIEYRDSLANRETALGDANVQGTGPAYAFGTQVQGVGLMPNTQGIFTYPKNLITGIQRSIHIETDKDITARVYIIVVTLRIDFQYEEEEAVVKYVDIAED